MSGENPFRGLQSIEVPAFVPNSKRHNDRTVFYGAEVAQGLPAFLQQQLPVSLSKWRLLCPDTPFIFSAALALSILRPEARELANEHRMPAALLDDVLQPIRIYENTLIDRIAIGHDEHWEYHLSASVMAIMPNIFCEHTAGVALVNGSIRPTRWSRGQEVNAPFLVKQNDSRDGWILDRVINTSPLALEWLEEWLEYGGFPGSVIYPEFQASIIKLLLSRMESGPWLHETLLKQLGAIGVEIPREQLLMTAGTYRFKT